MKHLFDMNNKSVYVIAEVGVNHNGSIEMAKELIDASVRVGADAVKFQTFKSEKLVTKKAEQADYQRENTGKVESQFDMLKRLELTENDFAELKQYCEKVGIDFLSTPFDEESAQNLAGMGIDAFKIGSGDLNNIPFIKKLDAFGIPIILSTGMSSLEEVKESVAAITKSPLVILHCTSCYPAPVEDTNLIAIQTMKQELNLPIGYSDHTSGVLVASLAVGLGATVIEKHITLDKNLEGPDHKASLEPTEFEEMVQAIRYTEKALGNGEKVCMPSEESTKKVARKSLVLSQDVQEGEVLTEAHLVIKRPGNGLAPKYFDDMIGKKAKYNMEADRVLSWDDVI